MRYNDDSFARLVGGAVKLASPEAGIDTCGDSGHVTLGNGQVFRFTVQEVTPGEAAAPASVDYTALTGKFYVNITRRDGTRDVGYPAIAADGTWRYHVPAGIRLVGMTSASAGDMVSGKLDLTEW